MAKILIAGSGFAGHYGALILNDILKNKGTHEITVITPNTTFNYLPSLVWVGVNKMKAEKTQFNLKKIYDKVNINFKHAFVKEVHPDNNFVIIEPSNVDSDVKSPHGMHSRKMLSENANIKQNSTHGKAHNENNENTNININKPNNINSANVGEANQNKIEYDFLLMATGPKLNFEATENLNPEFGYNNSICTPHHAMDTAKNYLALIEKMKKGDKVKIFVGTGHGTATCQGAAFEYIANIHYDLVERKLRDRAEITWLSNEPKLGDFGMDGVEVRKESLIYTSEMMAEGVFNYCDIKYEIKSHVHKIDDKKIYTENVNGEFKEFDCNFAMLLPPFTGNSIKWIGKNGEDIKEKICNPAGFIKVDAAYGKSYEELDGPDWPKTYQTQLYKNIFAAGINFAPPGPLSKPNKSPNGTIISPAPPRTGYTAELSGKAAALNIADMVEGKEPSHNASMASTPGLCVASMKEGFFNGLAGTIAVYPVARNRKEYPEYGRNLDYSVAEVGKAGGWYKIGLHYSFLYKLQAKPGWKIIP